MAFSTASRIVSRSSTGSYGVKSSSRATLERCSFRASPFAPPYFVKDLSRGGVGLEVEAPALPTSVKVGMPFLLEMDLTLGTLMLHGEVAWTSAGGPEVLPTFGVNFGTLGPDTVERLEKLLSLESLPPAPWRARICFGMDAVMKMP